MRKRKIEKKREKAESKQTFSLVMNQSVIAMASGEQITALEAVQTNKLINLQGELKLHLDKITMIALVRKTPVDALVYQRLCTWWARIY